MESLNWRKASYSAANGGGCIEVAGRSDRVLVRDTKDRTGPVLRFTPAAWHKFAEQVKSSLAPGSRGHCRAAAARRTAPAACRAATRIGSQTGANGGAYARSRAVISSTVIRFHSAVAAVSIRLADPS
jgi:Domain of unknown function (DUF397)